LPLQYFFPMAKAFFQSIVLRGVCSYLYWGKGSLEVLAVFLNYCEGLLPEQEQRTVYFLPTYWGEGSLEVVGSDDAVLVGVDDAEGLLELLDLLLAEEGEDVRPWLLGLLSLRRLEQQRQVETNCANCTPHLSSYINNDDMSWRSSLRDSVSRFFTSNFSWIYFLGLLIGLTLVSTTQ